MTSFHAKSLQLIRLIVGNVLVFGLLYVVVECSYSAYRYFLTDSAPESFALFEHPGETIRFDPIRGYSLTRTPSRVARVTHGKIEYVGTFRGNAQGFADRDDFSPRRSSVGERRIAILGDSFSVATMEPLNAPNWPDRVKDLSAASSKPLVTLNFSLDGGGLANWASILRNIVAKDGYELDGLVFAVAWDDLDRKFAMFDQVDSKRFLHARALTWHVSSQPKTRSEARVLLEKDANRMRIIVSPAQFDAFLTGHWRPRQWQFRLSARLRAIIAGQPKTEEPGTGFEPGQIALIKEIRQIADEHSWPIVVVQIPTREGLLDPGSRTNVDRTREFSEMLGATFVDGYEAFRGLSSQQIKDDWFQFDGHWNRGGSDQFAQFMATQLQLWVQAGAGREANMVDGVRVRDTTLSSVNPQQCRANRNCRGDIPKASVAVR